MLVVLFVLLAASGFAQSGQDARPLLRDVAEASKNLTTYRAEGHIAQLLDMGPMGGKRDLAFQVATRAPHQMHFEVSGGEEAMTGMPYMAVCDGLSGWAYFEKVKAFKKIGDDKTPVGRWEVGYCAPGTLTSFEHVADDLISAVITGKDHARFEGRTQPCTLVKAKYRVIKDVMIPPAMVLGIGSVNRTMCIDRTRLLILRDRLDADLDADPNGYHLLQTVTYDRIERNPNLDPALFEFRPPEGAKLIETPTAAPVKNLPATVPRVPPTGSTPETISRAEPEYSQEAWDEGIQGEITVRADIEADGSMTNVKVEHSLGYGLDEKAVECAKKWRFKPGTDRGRPVKMVTIIRLPFILPDKRPERPSAGPVARPVPPPRLPSSQLKRPTDLDDFFYLVAINFKAPEVCGKIDPMAEGRGGWSSKRGSEIWSLQSNCYRLLAGELRNPKLCDHVRPVRTDFLDGSKLDKTYCLTNMDSLHETISPNDYHMEPFVSFMRKMGYTDAQVQEYWCWNSSYHDVAGYAYKKLSEEKAFLDQVHSGPSYAEARSEARIRPAHAAEFLYQMVAEDTKDPNLCAKISPNATYAAWRGHTFLLRSHCYLSFALSERNTAFCDKLPQAGTSSHIDAENDSRQGCLDTVAIFSRPESRDELLAHGPLPFPQPVYLDKALEQIGYRRARTADLLPKPEPKDYEGFLFEMSLSGGPQKRATLIGRVMNLK